MEEVNRNMAGLADHKFRIGNSIVWANSLERALRTFREHRLGVLWRCDPKVLAAAEKKMDKVSIPEVTQLY